MTIGKVHRDQTASVRSILRDLARVSPEDHADAFRRQIGRLDGWCARIAAVGQVKAGKSTLLNTLAGRPGILPSDVNPWTSVVTNLRINVAGDPAQGARFEFFDETSWDRIISGEPGLRELAEEMLPEFDSRELRRQTEQMQARARRRLGERYDRLLGAHHAYDIVTPDLLERYVCAGPDPEEGREDEPAGRYTALTRVADVFLRNPDFAVPTILTDTPGINDPFLVRDEFTCQSLNRSEVFLVVLSAHQALTEVDISLIRMLARQGARDVVVFVNRIDELDDPATGCARILDDVSARLFEAAPDGSFPIVAGSAFWADLALDPATPAEDLAAAAADPALVRFVTEQRGDCPADPRARLISASGVAEARRRISETIDFGTGARFLARVMGEARAQMQALTLVSRRRRDILQERIEFCGAGRPEALVEDRQAELARLEELAAQMTRTIERAEVDLDRAMNAAWFDLTQEMDARTHEFLDALAGALPAFWERSDRAGHDRMEIDLLPLREAMEAGLHRRYAAARAQADALLMRALDQLTALASDEVDTPDDILDMAGLPGETVVAAFATARRSVAVTPLGKRQWAFWRRAELDVRATMEALRRIAAAEVLPSSGKLIEAFTETLAERISGGRERLRLVLGVVERLIEDRRERLRADRALLAGAGDGTLLRQRLVSRLQGDIEEIDDLLQILAIRDDQLHRRTLINAA